MEGFGIVASCKDETCCINPELSQYPSTLVGRSCKFTSAAWMYFSKNKNAESRPYECTSRCVLGEVPAPIHSSVVLVEIVHEKLLRCCAFRDVLLTMIMLPLPCRTWSARVCLWVVGIDLK